MKKNHNTHRLWANVASFLLLIFLFGSTSTLSAQNASDFQRALSQLPDYSTVSQLRPSTQALVNNSRAIYQRGLDFDKMTASARESFLVDFQNHHQQIVKASVPQGCVEECLDDREECIEKACGGDTSGACFCCIPCNLAFNYCWLSCQLTIDIDISRVDE